jgi:hypothetical protein
MEVCGGRGGGRQAQQGQVPTVTCCHLGVSRNFLKKAFESKGGHATQCEDSRLKNYLKPLTI